MNRELTKEDITKIVDDPIILERIEEVINDYQMSKVDVAAALGYSAPLVSYITNKKQKKPRSEFIYRFCKYFRVSMDYIVGISDIKRKPPRSPRSKLEFSSHEEYVKMNSDSVAYRNRIKDICMNIFDYTYASASSFARGRRNVPLPVMIYIAITENTSLDYMFALTDAKGIMPLFKYINGGF